VIKSLAIPDKAPLIVKIREKAIPIISEIELCWAYTNAYTVV
jgi:UDP-N-acetylmuramoylalanine--D-glutamate ligase